MTDSLNNHQELLSEAVMRRIGEMPLREAVRFLARSGLLNQLACERLAIRDLVAQLAREGIPRCEAFHVAATVCCCSYEKARKLFYDKI